MRHPARTVVNLLAGGVTLVVVATIALALFSSRYTVNPAGGSSASPPISSSAPASTVGTVAPVVAETATPDPTCSDGLTYYSSLDRVDESVDTEAAVAAAVAHVRVAAISLSKWNTVDGKEPSAHIGFYNNVYRLATLEIISIAKGSPADLQQVRLLGGQIGCDRWLVTGNSQIAVGSSYILFAQPLASPDGRGVNELTALSMWPVVAGNRVVTPVDGSMAVEDLLADVRGASSR